MRRFLLALLALVASFVLLPSAVARPAAADVSIDVRLGAVGPGGIGRSTETTTSRSNFIIVVVIDTLSPVAQAVTATIDLPEGLRWGNDLPDPSEGCTGTDPAVCTGRVERAESGIFDEGWFWDVLADRSGVYEITASVQPTEADPNPANNRTTLRLEVALPTVGGSAPGTGTAAVTASAARVTTTNPRAGSVVAASVRVSTGGAAVRPTRVACTGSIAGTRLTGAPAAAAGRATCTYRTPRGARGKVLRGSISFTARGQRFTKRFATRLG